MTIKTHITGNNVAGTCLNCEQPFSASLTISTADKRGGRSADCPHCGMSTLRIWETEDAYFAALSQSPQNLANNFCPSGGKEMFLTTKEKIK